LCSAQIVPTEIIEERDTGPDTLPAMNSSLWTDCDTGNITINLLSDEGSALEGVTIFLFRTDSAYKLLARVSTDASGIATLRPLGKISFLNDMYILRFEKAGYKVQEMEITYWNCEDVKREYSEYNQPPVIDAEPLTPEAKNTVPVSLQAPDTGIAPESPTWIEVAPAVARDEPEREGVVPCGAASLLSLLGIAMLSGHGVRDTKPKTGNHLNKTVIFEEE
ncbi:MAG: hypothetical protein ACOY58_00525, partial [Candidatus Micrarchaeota archaeon]